MTATPTHIPSILRSNDAKSVDFGTRKWLGQEPLSVAFSIGDQDGMDREIGLVVRNLAGDACKGLFAIRVVVGTAAAGGPAGSQTVVVSIGSEVFVAVADQVIDLFTDADGVASLTVTLGAAGTRHVRAVINGIAVGSGAISWV